jgi:hypothetical protein
MQNKYKYTRSASLVKVKLINFIVLWFYLIWLNELYI